MPPVIVPPVPPADDSDTETIRSETEEYAGERDAYDDTDPYDCVTYAYDDRVYSFFEQLAFGFNSSPGWRETPNLGDFRDGKWWCCCQPPQQAARRQAAKVNKNLGRFFHVCPKPYYPRSEQCGFFLWEDEAEARKAEIARRRPAAAEAPTAPAPTSALTSQPASAAPTPTPAPAPAPASASASQSVPTAPITPRPTPAKRRGDDDISMPSQSKMPRATDVDTDSDTDDDYFENPKPQSSPSPQTPQTPVIRPSAPPSTSQSPLKTPRVSTLRADLMNILHKNNVEVKPAVRAGIMSLLQTHEVADQGLQRSRDTCREAVKKRDAEIVVLNERIKDVEEEAEGRIEALEKKIAALEEETKEKE